MIISLRFFVYQIFKKKISLSVSVLSLLIFLSGFFPFQLNAQPFVVGVTGSSIRTFNPADMSPVTPLIQMTLNGNPVQQALTVTYNSDNQKFYALIREDFDAELVTVEPLTGVCTMIGYVGSARNQSFRTLTYSPDDSTLYTMYTGSFPPVLNYRTLAKIDMQTGLLTNLWTDARGFDDIINGAVIAYNQNDGYIYNWYNFVDMNLLQSFFLMDRIDLQTFAVTPVPMSGTPLFSCAGAVHTTGSNFIFTDNDSSFIVTKTGEADPLSEMDDPMYGLGYVTDLVLPVELTAFTSSVSENEVTLTWMTSNELNNSGFEIERSAEDRSSTVWTKIGNVSGHGTVTTLQNYSFTDRNLTSGKYKYRLKQIDFNGNFEYFNLNSEVVIGVPENFELSQNYPNPFNPSTKIEFQLPEDGIVNLSVYDNSGREVVTLVNEFKTAGYYSVNFSVTGSSSLSSGVYFYKITSDNKSITKKMLLVK